LQVKRFTLTFVTRFKKFRQITKLIFTLISPFYNSMNKILTAVVFTTALFAQNPAHAQLLSLNSTETNKSDKQQDWSFYTDAENRMLYIDFEKINVNLNGIVVKNKEGKVVFKDDALWELPVNTIYEVDFSKETKGEYIVEVKTFTTTLRKTVTIK
jgi:hypothetical protein